MLELLTKADKLTDIGKAAEAIKFLREIESAADAEFLYGEGAKIAELYGAAFTISGDAEKAAAAYFDAAQKDKFLRAQRGHIANYIFILQYLQNIAAKDLYSEMANFNNLFADIEPFPPIKHNHEKIKIGYLLPTPTKSSLSNFITPLFTNYDRDNFEVCVYTFSEKSDDFTQKIKDNADFKILDISSYYDAAKVIRNDEIDILFDFTAYGAGGDTLSILAYRPAPVQIVGIGWPGAVNLSFVDYVLADEFLVDDIMQDKALKLPHSLYFDAEEKFSATSPYSKENLRLGVFNNFMKITDEALLLWKEILQKLPEATLTLQDCSIYEERIPFMQNRLEELRFKNILSRIEIKTANENYFEDIMNTDIILDTFPYTGGFMTATAITLGTPVITLAGDRFSSKFSADILKTANLAEFIAYDKEEYVEKVINIASTLNGDFRENIRQTALKSELTDKTAYMQNIEAVYKKNCDFSLRRKIYPSIAGIHNIISE